MTAYATAEDLEAWTGNDAPDNAERLLQRATELIAHNVLTPTPTDAAGLPEDEILAEAVMQATCAQVEQWLAVGEDNAIAGYSRGTSMSVGGVAIGGQPATLAPRAAAILRAAGLTRPAGA
jgi:hypothetical protein